MTVYLVGAGPGDPGLITVRGAELIAKADMVVHDRLVNPDLLKLAQPKCEIVSAAKLPLQPTMTQEEINQLLVQKGTKLAHVIRLKGGDPFVFARGGEEALALIDAGVDFEIVPGISSAIAAPAYAGIPVTQRRQSLSLTIVTGHEDPHSPKKVDWDAIAKVGGTLVVLMGASKATQIAARLQKGGLAAETPAAFVHWGTCDSQIVWKGRLNQLGVEQPVPSPAVIVVGTVADIDLSWFKSSNETSGESKL